MCSALITVRHQRSVSVPRTPTLAVEHISCGDSHLMGAQHPFDLARPLERPRLPGSGVTAQTRSITVWVPTAGATLEAA
jgi:hypothetical protein